VRPPIYNFPTWCQYFPPFIKASFGGKSKGGFLNKRERANYPFWGKRGNFWETLREFLIFLRFRALSIKSF